MKVFLCPRYPLSLTLAALVVEYLPLPAQVFMKAVM